MPHRASKAGGKPNKIAEKAYYGIGVRPMRKRIKISMINLLGPVVIGDTAMLAAQNGHDGLATFAGILFLATFAIGAASVRVVWRA